MVGEQMTLFDLPESRVSNLTEWSHSRRNLLEQCPRKYYYEHYGSKQKTALEDPQKEKQRFLKRLGNRHLLAGDILHRVIRTYLNKFRQGDQWSLDWLLGWARKIYRTNLEYSRRYKHGTPLPDEKYPPILLLEFYYGLSDAEALCAEAEERLSTGLTNFITSENLAQFREGGSKASALMEEFVRLKEVHFTLRGRIDLAYPEGDRIVIVDWKIGGSGNSDDSLQMLAYALWAKEKFECPLDSIILHKAHLEDNTISTYNVSEKALTRVEARILQDLERMREADKYGIRGVVEAFTPCAQPKICEMCQFQEICPKE